MDQEFVNFSDYLDRSKSSVKKPTESNNVNPIEIKKDIPQVEEKIEPKEIVEEKIFENVQIETKEEEEDISDYYKVYRDKPETFSCDIELEGANLNDTTVRLILETKDWNLVFNGEIDQNGKATIPIKKLSLFEEGELGTIRMEVVAEGTLFVPWEEKFKVKLSKKVMVKFNESKVPEKNINTSTKPTVKVKF